MTEIVGPVRTIRFHDGTEQAYTPPKNSLDPRYRACTEHRPACDCREAERAEDWAEQRAMLTEVEDAAAAVLAGHATWAWRQDPVTGEGIPAHCMCTGCQIARRAHLLAGWAVSAQPQVGES